MPQPHSRQPAGTVPRSPVHRGVAPWGGNPGKQVVKLLSCAAQESKDRQLTPEIWSRSLDERLFDYATEVDLDWYVWA